MAWTPPATWSTGQTVTAEQLNEQLRDNLAALKAPATDQDWFDEGSDWSTGSTSFVDVDASRCAVTVDMGAAGYVLIGFSGTFYNATAGGRVYLDVYVDGARIGGDDGLLRQDLGQPTHVSFVRLWSLTEGLHTLKLQWKTNTGTAILYAGAGTTNNDVHGQFWASERA